MNEHAHSIPTVRPHVARIAVIVAIVAVAAATAAYALIGHTGGVSAADVAVAAGASSCADSGYQVTSRLDGQRLTVYDCSFGNGEKCVTYSGGIATDQTVLVRLLFANALSGRRPYCAS